MIVKRRNASRRQDTVEESQEVDQSGLIGAVLGAIPEELEAEEDAESDQEGKDEGTLGKRDDDNDLAAEEYGNGDGDGCGLRYRTPPAVAYSTRMQYANLLEGSTSTTTHDTQGHETLYPILSDVSPDAIDFAPLVHLTGEFDEKTQPKSKLPSVVIHRLLPDDTLEKLALMYNVQTDAIRMANGILTDLDFFPHKELVIPNPSSLPGEHATAEIDPELLEKQKRQWGLHFLMLNRACSKEIATYYLLLHDYNLAAATREYDDDIRWEKEQKERMTRQKKQRKAFERRQRVQSIPILSWAVRLLDSCIPKSSSTFAREHPDPLEVEGLLLRDVRLNS